MSVDALVTIDRSSPRILAIAKEALSLRAAESIALYFEALTIAVIETTPIFETLEYWDLFDAAAADPTWLAISLITNAEREGDGAKRLWSLAACSSNVEHKEQLKRHAVDESRHSLMYLALLDLVFPHAVDNALKIQLPELSPKFSLASKLEPVPGSPYAKPATIDDFIQMNIAEVRTTVHHLMQRRVLTRHVDYENRSRVTGILNALLRDELEHVAYTAALINREIGRIPRANLVSMMTKRFRDFDQITNEELRDVQFDCSVACCAKRPSCRSKTVGRFADSPL